MSKREENLIPFTSENQPPGHKKSRKGIPNRATLLKKWTGVKLDLVNPITKDKERGTVEDEIILALVRKARTGDVAAIKEVQDSLYGKIVEKRETDLTVNKIEVEFINDNGK